MAESHIQILYQGLDADENMLDLYDASKSFDGLARSLAIIGHYYETGEINSKAPFSSSKVYVLRSEEGSFKQNLLIAIAGGVVSAPFSAFAGTLLDHWLPPHNPQMERLIDSIEENNRLLSGDIDPKEPDYISETDINECLEYIDKNAPEIQALRGVTANAMEKIYRPVGRTAKYTTILAGCNQKPIRAMDEFMVGLIRTDELDNDFSITEGTIDTYAFRSRRGYFWDNNLERSIPFEYDGSSKLSAENDFSWSLHKRKPITLNGRYVRWFDGKPKKMIIRSTYREED